MIAIPLAFHYIKRLLEISKLWSWNYAQVHEPYQWNLELPKYVTKNIAKQKTKIPRNFVVSILLKIIYPHHL